MRSFTKLTGLVAPLPLKDVDTDMIIPAQFLTSTSREGYGQNLFRRLRDQDPDFFLNQERYRSAKILVADSNFGCGSSREHAVWALLGAGIEAVLAPSFADIFSSNSAKSGLPVIMLPSPVVEQILDAARAADYTVTVDLVEQQVTLADGTSVPFEFDSFRRHCIINGLDDIDYIASHRDEIDTFRRGQEATKFFDTRKVNYSDDAA